MKLVMSLLMIATLSCVELTSPARLCGQGPKYNLGTSEPTAPDRAIESGASAAANIGASDYVFPNTSITSIIDDRKKDGGGGGGGGGTGGSGSPPPPQCILPGRPCAPGISSCCFGLACVFRGGSTRVGYQCY
jgi:hypothetical protein